MQKYLFFTLLLFCSFSFASAQDALWLRYPVISPDGKQIVFSYKGDLFKVSADGGTAVPLSLNPAYDHKAVWSPDGKQIAFASDRFGNFDVFVMSAEGGQAQRLTTFSGNEVPTSFSPDGQKVLFNSNILDNVENSSFPSNVLAELYSVSVKGGRSNQVLSFPAHDAVYDKAGKRLIYHNRKGYENDWRKHHVSSVARDVMMFDVQKGTHTYLTTFAGEDRNPVFSQDENEVFYLSEKSGSFNVWKMSVSNPSQTEQISKHEKHPVRFLSIAQNNRLCYSYNGELYVKDQGAEARKISVRVPFDFTGNDQELQSLGEATEMSVSPNGKEVAFVARGEVFVASVDYGTTKQITNTPEQERSVSFSPDGKSLLYASERKGSWKIYQTKRTKDTEKYFYNSTLLKEEPVLESENETFQPLFSPDGKEVAFLEERVILRVINLETKQIRTIMGKELNYSYSDGDQWYQWSPDGKWFLVTYSPFHLFSSEVGLVSSDGKGKMQNLTESGYSDDNPTWALDGKAVLWFSDQQGFRSHGSWGSHTDAYAMFFTQDAYNQFTMSKEEYENWKADEKKEDKKDEKKDGKTEAKTPTPLEINLQNIQDRTARLTINSSALAGALFNKEGTKLYYLSRFEKGFDLWVNDLKEKETKLLVKLDANSAYMEMDAKKENLFVLAQGKIQKIALSDNSKKPVAFSADMKLDRSAERAYMFEHAWRQVLKKFYDPQLHGIDWNFYKKEYERFLPHINNNYDYADMLSEILGELNGSHTGSGYRFSDPKGDQTASLGVFYDQIYTGKGLKIAEVIDKSPLLKAKQAITAGCLIEKIDGVEITENMDFYPLLNRKAGKTVLLSIFNPQNQARWDETIRPISLGAENELLYERWVKKRREQVEKLSNGRLGYVHVRGMNSPSFRHTYSEVLGRHAGKEAIVIDTRFNGGGWLHDDLATFFGGKNYITFAPRGQVFGGDPQTKWTKPSILVVSEGNYSDAHGFPFAYRALNVGKIVGMPVPGTMTAVWWETLQDQTLYFGIPQVGTKDNQGKYLENLPLEPDFLVNNEYENVQKGRDQQLEKAVELLLKDLEKK